MWLLLACYTAPAYVPPPSPAADARDAPVAAQPPSPATVARILPPDPFAEAATAIDAASRDATIASAHLCGLGDIRACAGAGKAYTDAALPLSINDIDRATRVSDVGLSLLGTACGAAYRDRSPEDVAHLQATLRERFEALQLERMAITQQLVDAAALEAHTARLTETQVQVETTSEAISLLGVATNACYSIAFTHRDRAMWHGYVVETSRSAATRSSAAALEAEETSKAYATMQLLCDTTPGLCSTLDDWAADDAEQAQFRAQAAANRSAFRAQMAGILLQGAGDIAGRVAVGQQQLAFARAGMLFDPATGTAITPGAAGAADATGAPAGPCGSTCLAQCDAHVQQAREGNVAASYLAEACVYDCHAAQGGCGQDSASLRQSANDARAKAAEFQSEPVAATPEPQPAPPAKTTCPAGQTSCMRKDGTEGCMVRPSGTQAAHEDVYCPGE
jgi:hypothetical protein